MSKETLIGKAIFFDNEEESAKVQKFFIARGYRWNSGPHVYPRYPGIVFHGTGRMYKPDLTTDRMRFKSQTITFDIAKEILDQGVTICDE